MESSKKPLKKFNDEYIVFDSKSKNFNFYYCPFKKCTGKYKEDIHSGIITQFKCHSGSCYNDKKMKQVNCPIKDSQMDVEKILNELEREEKKKKNNFLKSMIIQGKMKSICNYSKNETFLFSNKNYVGKILNLKETENLIKECDIHLSIEHPRIVNCLNYFTYDNNFYLITEYCPKKTLADIEYKIEEVDKIRYLNQTIEAIHFLHKNKIAHRDIKLENVFIDINNNIKLGDFGCVSYGEIFSGTQGTLAYICPQMREKKDYTQKCDVWSFGIMSYCLLFGHSSDYVINFLNFMEEIKINKKLNSENLKKIIVEEIKNLDFTGISDHNKENIMKMLEYEEEKRSSIWEIKFI